VFYCPTRIALSLALLPGAQALTDCTGIPGASTASRLFFPAPLGLLAARARGHASAVWHICQRVVCRVIQAPAEISNGDTILLHFTVQRALSSQRPNDRLVMAGPHSLAYVVLMCVLGDRMVHLRGARLSRKCRIRSLLTRCQIQLHVSQS
jgi:hypothetical protein